MGPDDFTDTTTELARQSGRAPATIRAYANEGLLEFVLASDGTRLFRKGQASRVQELCERRLAKRGKRNSKAPL